MTYFGWALLSIMSVAQIPQGCNTYSTERETCSDFESNCTGSLSDVIDYVEGDGIYGMIYATLSCSPTGGGGCTGKNCVTCQSYPNIPVQAFNALCLGGGGGGGCCTCDDGSCAHECCTDIRRQACAGKDTIHGGSTLQDRLDARMLFNPSTVSRSVARNLVATGGNAGPGDRLDISEEEERIEEFQAKMRAALRAVQHRRALDQTLTDLPPWTERN